MLLFWNSPDKDSGDDPEMLVDNRILTVEEEGTLTSADLDGNSGPNESKLIVMYYFNIYIYNFFKLQYFFISFIRCCHVQGNASWIFWRNDRITTNCNW